MDDENKTPETQKPDESEDLKKVLDLEPLDE